MRKPLSVWITTNCGKFFKKWNTRPPDLLLEKSVCRSGSNRTGHGTTDWFQIGNGVLQGCILSLAYLTYMQSTSWEMLGWKKHKLESRLPGEISISSDMQMTPPLWQKEPLERGEWNSWLKTQHSESEDHGIWSHHFMGSRWGNIGNSGWVYFFGLQNHCRWWLQPWN